MKTFLSVLSLCLISISLSGQSSLVKLGAIHRNDNYLASARVGYQVGYRYNFSNGLAIEANLGGISSHWDIVRSDILIHTDKEQTTYLEAIVFLPFLRRFIPSGNLKVGMGYIGSHNTFDYLKEASIREDILDYRIIGSATYHLHEVGLTFDYIHPVRHNFVIHISTGVSTSLNRVPSYNSVTFNGFGTSFSMAGEKTVTRYRGSIGVGYLF